jgi:hypothetical protein
VLFVLSVRFAPSLEGQASSPASPAGSAQTKDGASQSKTRADEVKTSEDWTTPLLPDSSTLPVPEALEGGKTDYPEFTRELQQVQWRLADPIDLWIVRPIGVKKPPVILYLYSFPSDTDRFENPEFEKFVTRDGYAAVGFVSALTGQRYHDIPQKKWFISELQPSLAMSAHDVQMILNYLSSRGDLDMSRVGMYGTGSGASIAIMAAAVDPRIKVLDLLDPWGDWPDWLAKSTMVPEDERPNYLKPEFLSKLENLDPVKWLPELKTQTVRLQYVEEGTVTPDAARKRVIAAAGPNVKVIQYPDNKAFAESVAATGKRFDWIKEQLRPAAAGQSGSGNMTAGPPAGK